ncbi:hypothetical protein Zm00014a_000019 [Zea mays]|uniref:Uncharacterized protein n=1 Tax=Zea mays TaxID=4577 RepID=A0A3L6E9G2_MAIZE|nr:hypothetical protein Zm00014a_000019 [Zea mays]
MRCYRVNML